MDSKAERSEAAKRGRSLTHDEWYSMLTHDRYLEYVRIAEQLQAIKNELESEADNTGDLWHEQTLRYYVEKVRAIL